LHTKYDHWKDGIESHAPGLHTRLKHYGARMESKQQEEQKEKLDPLVLRCECYRKKFEISSHVNSFATFEVSSHMNFFVMFTYTLALLPY
jgi:hypothetical protein